MYEDRNAINTYHKESGDGFAVDSPEKRLDQVRALIQSTLHNLDKISRVVDKIQQDQKKEMYKSMPGVEGVFDGTCLVCDDASKHEVPANYAAKSRLVYGDRLKIVEEDGKKVFKQIQKLDRKEVKGVLSKKEGKWYLLSDSGTFKVSDIAAEFNNAGLNEEAVGLIPADQPNAPFAALDMIIKKSEPKADTGVSESKAAKAKDNKPREVKQTEVQKIERKPSQAPVKVSPKPLIKKEPFVRAKEDRKDTKKGLGIFKKQEKTEPVASKEYVAGLLEDDDLR